MSPLWSDPGAFIVGLRAWAKEDSFIGFVVDWPVRRPVVVLTDDLDGDATRVTGWR